MASKSSVLGALLYEAETTFGEDVDTTATRLRPIGPVSYDLSHPSQMVDILKQYPHEGVAPVRMPMSGTLSFELNLTGHGGTCAGAVPASALATLLGKVFGLTANSLATGDTADGAGTAAAPGTTAASGIVAGALVKFGAIGDARANGQFAAVSGHTSNVATLLTALPVVPNAADVIFAGDMIYGSQTAGTAETLASVRILFQSGQQQYLCHGCFPTGAEFNLSLGSIPTIKLTYSVSWFELKSSTFPSAVAVQDYGAAPIAGGSMFLAALGTSARTTVTARSVSFSVGLNNQPEMGINGVDEHQVIVGCNRGPASLGLEMVIDSEAAGTDTYGDLFDTSENARIARHALWTMSTGDGRALAFYWPNLHLIEKPIQFDDGGVLRKKLMFRPDTGTTTTTDLTLSPWRLAIS